MRKRSQLGELLPIPHPAPFPPLAPAGPRSPSAWTATAGRPTSRSPNLRVALETEVSRAQADNSGGSYEANYKCIFEKTFTFGSGESYSITEAGVFDGATETGSTMLDRFTFTSKSVDSDTDLYIKVTITVS